MFVLDVVLVWLTNTYQQLAQTLPPHNAQVVLILPAPSLILLRQHLPSLELTKPRLVPPPNRKFVLLAGSVIQMTNLLLMLLTATFTKPRSAEVLTQMLILEAPVVGT